MLGAVPDDLDFDVGALAVNTALRRIFGRREVPDRRAARSGFGSADHLFGRTMQLDATIEAASAPVIGVVPPVIDAHTKRRETRREIELRDFYYLYRPSRTAH